MQTIDQLYPTLGRRWQNDREPIVDALFCIDPINAHPAFADMRPDK